MPYLLLRVLPITALVISNVAAVARCRYNATAPDTVSYYTCTELSDRYSITIERFFLLNPLLDPDCSSIQAGEPYCVAGTVLPTTTDGSCDPDSHLSCLGYSRGQCCNSETWTCGGTREDCQAGTCASGLCEVKDPGAYSLDGTCGPSTGDKRCGGKWGDCCNASGQCGDGPGFCDEGNCWYGNCDVIVPDPVEQEPLPIWATGNTTDGTCGPSHENMICNVVWGYCCASTGKCGVTDVYCGTGCQPLYGNCTIETPSDPEPGNVSTDGSCGGEGGLICTGSSFGDCCSAAGWCGSTDAFCTLGCQSDFGTCTGDDSLSPDGTCGGSNGYFCPGSGFGDCCSSGGWCGSTDAHCTTGCQSDFGTCTGNSNLSPDGTCGGSNGYMCSGSSFGDCCSSSGYCGSTTAYCSTGCQLDFGDCDDTNISTDGSCAAAGGGTTCAGSTFGGCCSSGGYCGTSTNHCAQGCQIAFSDSCISENIPTLDGICGPSSGGLTCAGGPFDGQCCAGSGYCGTTSDHCGTGCQAGYGSCT